MLANSQQLREIKNYLQSQNKQSINQKELEKLSLNSHKPCNYKSNSPNYSPWIIGGGLVFLGGIVIYFLTRKKTK